MAMGEKSYITGRAKRWFWISTVMLVIIILWSTISSALYPALLKRVVIEDRTAFLMAGILTFLHTAALAVIMGVYGLRNKVKGFKIMFLILGGLYILNAYGHYLSNYYVSYILTFRGLTNVTMIHIANAVALAQYAAWGAFAVMVIVHRRTGRVLRIMGILLLIAQVAELVYAFNIIAVQEWLSLRYEAQIVASLTWFLDFVMTLAAYVPVICLLSAMSFSRMKAIPDTVKTEAPAPETPEPEGPDFPQV